MDKKEFALSQHEKWNGKIEVISRAKIETPEDLAVAYTPGVAEPCLKIAEDVDLSYKYTRRGNLVAVVTDGTAVLGLGDIGTCKFQRQNRCNSRRYERTRHKRT